MWVPVKRIRVLEDSNHDEEVTGHDRDNKESYRNFVRTLAIYNIMVLLIFLAILLLCNHVAPSSNIGDELQLTQLYLQLQCHYSY